MTDSYFDNPKRLTDLTSPPKNSFLFKLPTSKYSAPEEQNNLQEAINKALGAIPTEESGATARTVRLHFIGDNIFTAHIQNGTMHEEDFLKLLQDITGEKKIVVENQPLRPVLPQDSGKGI